ncbi:hypothetical protein [Zhihengliuella halotolerans]|uniref:Uncharacterized protein n=1 Tax=Zhihengliuella halotolerans TaxID=370736 RepID=A0A4Q8A9E7_9MICC|nr:hypothetical protein [Zhihengliuella halotolerans]RZU60702.1 hypothetical protein EV380_0247 [Zhihengliuella halotolerans]
MNKKRETTPPTTSDGSGTPGRRFGAWASLPGTVKAAVWWWGAMTVIVLGFSIAAFGNFGLVPGGGDRVGLLMIGILLAALTLMIGWGTGRLWLGHLAGRALLTTFGLIGGLPLLLRGPRLMLPALGLLIGVVLLWLPASQRYFKPQAKAARLARKRMKP